MISQNEVLEIYTKFRDELISPEMLSIRAKIADLEQKAVKNREDFEKRELEIRALLDLLL